MALNQLMVRNMIANSVHGDTSTLLSTDYEYKSLVMFILNQNRQHSQNKQTYDSAKKVPSYPKITRV